MFGRLVLVFLGLTLFITSCNNLLSQWGGADKLRTLELEDVVRSGIGDANYIQLKGICLGPDLLTWQGSGEEIVFFPVDACQRDAASPTESMPYQVVGWTYISEDSVNAYYPRLPAEPISIKGLVRESPRSSREYVKRKFDSEEKDLIWLRLDARPIHWGWWVAGMIVPALLILGMESRSFKRKKQT
jgi:hypothetical protein